MTDMMNSISSINGTPLNHSALSMISNSSSLSSSVNASATSANGASATGSSASSAASTTALLNLTNEAGQYSAEYLQQLLKDKKQLAAFPNIFLHAERLIDEEINRVRVNLFQLDRNKFDPLVLPEPDGQTVTLQEKVYVPVKDFPDYNFVGRILGPRGMTAKQLEQDCGCKIMVRGKGSMRDKAKEDQNRGKPNWEHLNDELHVLIQVEDTENRARLKVQRAVEEVQKLLIPASDGEDELKRKQLMELAIINGTYRPAAQNKLQLVNSTLTSMAQQRLLAPMALAASSPLRSPALAGTPIILSPTRIGGTPPASVSTTIQSQIAGIPSLVPAGSLSAADLQQAAAAQLLYSPFDPATLAAMTQYQYSSALSTPLMNATGADYAGMDPQTGQLLASRH